jgi:hypothetical protein
MSFHIVPTHLSKHFPNKPLLENAYQYMKGQSRFTNTSLNDYVEKMSTLQLQAYIAKSEALEQEHNFRWAFHAEGKGLENLPPTLETEAHIRKVMPPSLLEKMDQDSKNLLLESGLFPSSLIRQLERLRQQRDRLLARYNHVPPGESSHHHKASV